MFISQAQNVALTIAHAFNLAYNETWQADYEAYNSLEGEEVYKKIFLSSDLIINSILIENGSRFDRIRWPRRLFIYGNNQIQ